MQKLTTKQFKFKEGILQGLTGFDSARQADYRGNDNTLRAIASENLTKPNIIEAIDEGRAKIEAKSGYDVVNWLQDTRSDRERAIEHGNDSAVAAFSRLLAQHVGALELDNKQRQTQLAIAIKAEQVAIDTAIAKALQDAPDAMAE